MTTQTTTWAGDYIRGHDLDVAIDQIEDAFDVDSATAVRVKALSVSCDRCDGTGEVPSVHLMGAWSARTTTQVCPDCRGRCVYALITIDGEPYRAALMDAYCLIEHGTAELDVAASYRELERICG